MITVCFSVRLLISDVFISQLLFVAHGMILGFEFYVCRPLRVCLNKPLSLHLSRIVSGHRNRLGPHCLFKCLVPDDSDHLGADSAWLVNLGNYLVLMRVDALVLQMNGYSCRLDLSVLRVVPANRWHLL
jgi:hypothetical protein